MKTWLNQLSRTEIMASCVMAFIISLVLNYNYVDLNTSVLAGYGIVPFMMAVGAFLMCSLAFIFLRKEQNKTTRNILFILSILFGLLNMAGLSMFYYDSLMFAHGTNWALAFIFGWIAYSCLFWAIATIMLRFLGVECSFEQTGGDARKVFWISLAVIFACWIPYLYAYYPASIDWDATVQMCRYMGYWEPTNHFPWFSTEIIGRFYAFGVAIGNENLGIFIYVLIRDILIAAIYANVARLLTRFYIRRGIVIITVLYYGVTPVWGCYAKSAFKDTFAAALFCWYICCLIEIVYDLYHHEFRLFHWICYAASGVLAAGFRSNSWYAVVPTGIVLAAVCIYQQRRQAWKPILIIALSFCIYSGYYSYVFNVLGVQKGEAREALSIPLQQIARIVKYHPETITDNEKEIINKVLDYDSIAEVYDPLISDPIKDRWKADATGEDVRQLLECWITLALRHPRYALEATLGNSYGYYAFTPKHEYGAGNWNAGMTLLNGMNPEWDDFALIFDLHYVEDRSELRSGIEKWEPFWEQLPVLSMTNVIALYTWLSVLLFLVMLDRHQWRSVLPFLPIWLLIATCIASPVNDCFRYYAGAAASVPSLFALLHIGREMSTCVKYNP